MLGVCVFLTIVIITLGREWGPLDLWSFGHRLVIPTVPASSCSPQVIISPWPPHSEALGWTPNHGHSGNNQGHFEMWLQSSTGPASPPTCPTSWLRLTCRPRLHSHMAPTGVRLQSTVRLCFCKLNTFQQLWEHSHFWRVQKAPPLFRRMLLLIWWRCKG